MIGELTFYAGLDLPTNFLDADGAAVSRLTYPALLSALTTSATATCTAGSADVAGTLPLTLIRLGCVIESPNFPAGTTVVARGLNGLTLSNPAQASGDFQLTFFPWGNGDGATTFNLPAAANRAAVGASLARPFQPGALTNRYPGELFGEERVTLTAAQMPPHAHSVPFNPTSGLAAGPDYNLMGAPSVQTDTAGGGEPHDNIPPSFCARWIIQVSDSSAPVVPAP